MKLSSFILVGLLPLLLVCCCGLYLFSASDAMALQSLAHKAFASLVALSVLNAWLRFSDLIAGVKFNEDLHNVEKHQRVVFYRTRLMCGSAIVSLIFAFA